MLSKSVCKTCHITLSVIQAQEVLNEFAEKQKLESHLEDLAAKCNIIRADLQKAAAQILLTPSLVDLITEAELQAAQDNADDEWLPAPGSSARSKACKQLRELREAIELNHWDVDAENMAAFLALPFSMEETTGERS